VTRRERQAEQTRTEILDAARRLFAERGYRATTVTRIADEAGVAVQTIYDSIGSKAAIVAALNDRLDESAGIPGIAGRIPEIDDPGELLDVPVRITSSVLATNGDIARTAFRGSSSEPELAALRREGIRRHREGCHGIARRLESLGGLPAGADVARAGDAIALLCDPEVWLAWIDDYGWTVDEVARWTHDALVRVVLERAPR
jgi:AcrR family transcriptional regulator